MVKYCSSLMVLTWEFNDQHKVKVKVIPVFNLVQCHEDLLGEWSYNSTRFNVGTRWR